MKKLMFVSLIVLVLALSGCNHNVVTPEPTVVEPTLPKEGPTQIPTPVEEPTDIPVPTEEPTATPTLESMSTVESLITTCSAEFILPEDLSIDLGEYGTFHLIGSYPMDRILVGDLSSVVTNQELDLKTNGGEVSFQMKSRGVIVYNAKGVTLKGEDLVVVSEDSEFGLGVLLVPSASEIVMLVEQGVSERSSLIAVYYETGEHIDFNDNSLRVEGGDWNRSCNQGYTVVDVKADNTSAEVVISADYALLLKDTSNIEMLVFNNYDNFQISKGLSGWLIPTGEEITVRFFGEEKTFSMIPLSLIAGLDD